MSGWSTSHRGEGLREGPHGRARARGEAPRPSGRLGRPLSRAEFDGVRRSPMNFLERGKVADYVVTGAWSEKAVARREPSEHRAGEVHVRGTDGKKGQVYARVLAASGRISLTAGAFIKCTVQATRPNTASSTPIGSVSCHFPSERAPVVGRFVRAESWAASVRRAHSSNLIMRARRSTWTERRHHRPSRRSLSRATSKDLPAIFRPHARRPNQFSPLYNPRPPRSGFFYLGEHALCARGPGRCCRGFEEPTGRRRGLLYDAIEGSGRRLTVPGGRTALRSIMNVVWPPDPSRDRGRVVKQAQGRQRHDSHERPPFRGRHPRVAITTPSRSLR